MFNKPDDFSGNRKILFTSQQSDDKSGKVVMVIVGVVFIQIDMKKRTVRIIMRIKDFADGAPIIFAEIGMDRKKQKDKEGKKKKIYNRRAKFFFFHTCRFLTSAVAVFGIIRVKDELFLNCVLDLPDAIGHTLRDLKTQHFFDLLK